MPLLANHDDDAGPPAGTGPALLAAYRAVRGRTEHLAAPLSAEDQTIQSMPDASPTKWHRAHTSWFFETFLLQPMLADYVTFDPAYAFLFNSYYEAVGPRHARPQRGLLSRPGVAEIAAYRAHVDAAMARLILLKPTEVADLLAVGLNHEQQHQELLLTDIKHAFSTSPLLPAYARAVEAELPVPVPAVQWIEIAAGLHMIGAEDGDGFRFDNAGPRHPVYLGDYAIADMPVTNGEFRAFIEDGGYRRADLWLSDGWAIARNEDWQAPAYWRRDGAQWLAFTLHGERAVRDDEPVCHVSFHEAWAFAHWSGCRLPTEFEWEVAARRHPAARQTLEALNPAAVRAGFAQQVWEWTGSAYLPYPGYRIADGALGEYNGKFMSGQMVLRGRSCATPDGHARLSYRNFFPPHARWQFSGFRLARDV